MKEIKANNYSIWIGNNVFSKINLNGYSQVAIIVDENTQQHCLPILLNKIPQLKKALIIKTRSGEENKNIATCDDVWKELTTHHFDRESIIINLGGGVITDLGGYCAATYKRGVDFINIPTTLLSMVDASIGGKVGVNLNTLKNQIGLFKNPKNVLVFPVFLETLNNRDIDSGFAEIIKHALISDKNKWKFIKSIDHKNIEWNTIITKSISIKNKIVLLDPIEKRERKKLNFGHTYGHAIEAFYLSKKTPISHGEAVFMGMLLETDMSYLTANEKLEIKNYILTNYSLPHIPQKKELIKLMRSDKKNKNNQINFSLLKKIGECTINNLFSENEL